MPYYAGYSEAFVEGMLQRFGLVSGQVVLDPMNGSGTTTCVAQRLGLSTIGVELNPAAQLVARAKDRSLARPDDVGDLVKAITSLPLRDLPSDEVSAEGSHWVSDRAFRYLRAVATGCAELNLDPIPYSPELELAAARAPTPSFNLAALIEATLLRFVRKLCPPKTSKNPTWLKACSRARRAVAEPPSEWGTLAIESANDLVEYFGSASKTSNFLCVPGDARALPLPDECADAVITSPPYLTRIDYAVGTGVELALLGYDTDPTLGFRDLRLSLMGTPCVRRDRKSHVDGMRLSSRIVRSIAEHDSYAAQGYYAKIAEQYFVDAESIVREIARVLNPGGTGALVVQDSWFKDVHLPLGKAYVELLEHAGLDAEIDSSEAVRRHIGQINTGARKYQKGEVHEHVVVFGKPRR